MEPVTLHYSEALMHQVVRSFMGRLVGWRYVAAWFICLAATVYLVGIGDRSWLVGVFGSGLALAFLVPMVGYFARRRALLIKFRRLRPPESIFEPLEECFRISSEFGTLNMPWSQLTEVWRFPSFWLLFFSKSEFITLPLSDLNGETREFVLNRIHAQRIPIS